MVWNKRCLAFILAVSVCMILFFGCQNKPKMSDPAAALEALAIEYWTKRLVERDYDFTYDTEVDKASLPFS